MIYNEIGNTFNIEEINLVHSCKSKAKGLLALLTELGMYRQSAEPDMAEIIERTIYKLSYTTSTQLQEILDYPAENGC